VKQEVISEKEEFSFHYSSVGMQADLFMFFATAHNAGNRDSPGFALGIKGSRERKARFCLTKLRACLYFGEGGAFSAPHLHESIGYKP
jgi:hypothetical protein